MNEMIVATLPPHAVGSERPVGRRFVALLEVAQRGRVRKREQKTEKPSIAESARVVNWWSAAPCDQPMASCPITTKTSKEESDIPLA
jgi:hypothetical protein